MAEGTLELTRTIEVLNEYAQAWANAYKAELIANGKRATGNLIRSVKGYVKIEGEVYSAVLNVADYYENVEFGRRSKKQDSSIKPPPISAILKWIQVKPVIPRENGISKEQLAWAIAKKIQRDGIPPTYAMREANDLTFRAFESKLKQALNEDLEGAAYTLVQRAIIPRNI